MTRQFPLTFTAQIPFRVPCNSCKSKPGRLRSRGSAAAFNRPRISRSRSACFAWIPRLFPVTKKRSSPLCRKLLIATTISVTHAVTVSNPVGCRHRHLAEYFGDRYTRDGCGACDYCLDELEPSLEPVLLARQILSCVARVGQRFGATHVASVLRGHASDQVVSRGHNTLSTFGLLPEATIGEVRGYIQQLRAFNLLRTTDDMYAVLTLTPKGLALLKDETSCPDLTLARQRPPRKDAARARSRIATESWEGVDRALFERLRAVRLETARERAVPPYVIFHDATLREMARLRPASLDAFRAVKGVGARKADDIGERFLSAIREHAV